jgi:hypothetical protein
MATRAPDDDVGLHNDQVGGHESPPLIDQLLERTPGRMVVFIARVAERDPGAGIDEHLTARQGSLP